jgi:MFS family permease
MDSTRDGLMLRYGPRRMVMLSGALLMVGLAIAAITTEKWQLWLGMGVLLGIAPGLTAMQLSAMIASRWFVARRGLVIGLLSGAVATGTLIFMPVAAWASERWGWRAALLIPSIGALLSWLQFIWLARDRPQELDLLGAGLHLRHLRCVQLRAHAGALCPVLRRHGHCAGHGRLAAGGDRRV